MKRSTLTVNGVSKLYSSPNSCLIKLQVVYHRRFVGKENVMTRMSDGKALTPIVHFKTSDFFVGDVLIIKQAKFVSWESSFHGEGDDPLPLEQMPQLLVLSYSLDERVTELYGSPSSCTDYWQTLYNLRGRLGAFERSVQGLIEREGARMTENSNPGDQLRERGNSYYKQKQFEHAISCYKSATKKKPYDDRLYSNLAMAYIQMEQFPLAIAFSKWAIRLNPFNMKAYYRACHAMEQRRGGCIKTLQREKEDYEIFLLVSACKIVCDTNPEMDKFNNYLKMFKFASLPKPVDTPAPAKSAARSRSLSIASSSKSQAGGKTKGKPGGKGMPSPAKPNETPVVIKVNTAELNTKTSTDSNNSQSSKKKKSNEIAAVPEDPVDDPAREAAAAAAATEREVAAVAKAELAALEKKKKEDDGVLAPGYSNKDVVHVTMLREARRSFRECNYKLAIDFYAAALETPGQSSQRSRREQQLVALVVCVCRVSLGVVSECVVALPALKEMLEPARDADMEAPLPLAPVHYLLAMVFHNIWQHADAVLHAEECRQCLKKDKNKLPLQLPGFVDNIPQTEVTYLQSWYNEGLWREEIVIQVLAKCRYGECDHLKGTIHYRNIVRHADLYGGHVSLSCEDDCSISYHIDCWRILKETLAGDDAGRGRLADKDFINHRCLTPDCNCLIVTLIVYDKSGDVKNNFNNKDRSATDITATKQKKKKNKKKANQTVQHNKNKSKNNSLSKDLTIEDDEDLEDGKENFNSQDCGSTISTKGFSKPGSNLPLDELHFEHYNIKILKPDNTEKTDNREINKKPRKKNKMQRAFEVKSLLPEPLDDISSEQNEYVAKIRRLNEQKLELEGSEATAVDAEAQEDTEVVDIRNPFYMPQLLYDTPQALDQLFFNKTNPINHQQISRSSTITMTQSGVDVLLSFMYDFIDSEGPLNVKDPKLKLYMNDNFPEDSIKYVQECGGLCNFLLMSAKFAIIDDIICVRKDVLDVQYRMLSKVMEKFTNSKYNMSDKYKAQQFMHLLVDLKLSSSSSTSSILSNATSTSNENSSSRLCPVLSSTAVINKSGSNDSVAGDSSTAVINKSGSNDSVAGDNSTAVNNKSGSSDSVAGDNSTAVNNKSGSSDRVAGDSSTTVNNKSGSNDRVAGDSSTAVNNKCSSSDSVAGDSSTAVNNKSGSNDSVAGDSSTAVNNKSGSNDSVAGDSSTAVNNKSGSSDGVAGDSSNKSFTSDFINASNRTVVASSSDDLKATLSGTGLDEGASLFKHLLQGSSTSRKTSHKERVNGVSDVEVPIDIFNTTCEDVLNSTTSAADSAQLTALQQQLEESERRSQQLENQLRTVQEKLSHLRTKKTVETNTLKKQLDDAKDSVQMEQNRSKQQQEQFAVEQRRTQAEKRKLQDENKALVSQKNALQLRCDQQEQQLTALKQDLEQKTSVSSRVEEELRVLQESLSSAADRARAAELSYIDLNRSLVAETINRVIAASTVDAHRLEEMERQASDHSVPTLNCVRQARLSLLLHHQQLGQYKDKLQTDTARFTAMLNAGRPLSSLPIRNLPGLPKDLLGHVINKLLTVTCGLQVLVQPAQSISPTIPTATAPLIPRSEVSSSRGFDIGGRNSGSYVSPPQAVSGGVKDCLAPGLLGNVRGRAPDYTNEGTNTHVASEKCDGSSVASDAHKLFVGKLPLSLTSDQLKNIFSKFGEVFAANVVDSTPNFATKKFGYVTFVHIKDRNAALAKVQREPLLYGPHVINVEPMNSAYLRRPYEAATSSPSSPSSPLHRCHEAQPLAVRAGRVTPADVGHDNSKAKFQKLHSVAPSAEVIAAATHRKAAVTASSSGSLAASSSVGFNYKYQQLAEQCQKRLGPDYSMKRIQDAIGEVRRCNNNKLSGLAEDTIIERVVQHLRPTAAPLKNNITSIAPWAAESSVKRKPSPPTLPRQTSLDEPKEECCICLMNMDKPEDVMKLDCDHLFHKKCISDWLKEKRDCPICRHHTINKQEFPLLGST